MNRGRPCEERVWTVVLWGSGFGLCEGLEAESSKHQQHQCRMYMTPGTIYSDPLWANHTCTYAHMRQTDMSKHVTFHVHVCMCMCMCMHMHTAVRPCLGVPSTPCDILLPLLSGSRIGASDEQRDS